MPEATDPTSSVGYLIAAAAVALSAIAAYSVSVMQRLAAARARKREILEARPHPLLPSERAGE
jgi:hypothetical protein